MDISIVIPCYKSNTILDTLNSIFSINNYGVDFEVICCIHDIDDITIDLIKSSIFSKSVRIVFSKNKGVVSNRNEGIRNASGKYLFFLDSDDLIKKSFFAHFLYLSHFSFDMCYVTGDNFSSNNHSNDLSYYENDYDHFFSDREKIQFSYCSYFFKTKFIIDNHLFVSEEIMNSEDYLFIAMCLSCKPSLLISNRSVFIYNNSLFSLSKSLSINDILSSFVSFKLLFILLQKYSFVDSQNRYSQIFVTSILDKCINISSEEKKECLNYLKSFDSRRIIRLSPNSCKKWSYLVFGYRITWLLIRMYRNVR